MLAAATFLSNNGLVNDLLVPMLDWCELNSFTHTEKSKTKLFEMKLQKNPSSIPKGQKALLIDQDYLLILLNSLLMQYNGNWETFTKSLYPLRSVRSVYIHNVEALNFPGCEPDVDTGEVQDNPPNCIFPGIEMKQSGNIEQGSDMKQFAASCSDMKLSNTNVLISWKLDSIEVAQRLEDEGVTDLNFLLNPFNTIGMCIFRKLFRCLATVLGKTQHLLFGDVHFEENLKTLQAADLSKHDLNHLVQFPTVVSNDVLGTWNICLMELIPTFTRLKRIIVGDLVCVGGISALLRNNAATLELFLVTSFCADDLVSTLVDATHNIVYPCMTHFNEGFDEEVQDLKEIETVISAFPHLKCLYLHSHLDEITYRFQFWELIWNTLKQLRVVSVCDDHVYTEEWTAEEHRKFSEWKATLTSFQVE